MFDSKKGQEIIKHHIDMNRENNNKNNLLFLTMSKHCSLHRKSYNYLVKLGLINKYIKWFKKNFLNWGKK